MFKVLFSFFFILIILLLVAFLVLLERNFLRLDQKRKRPNIVRWFRCLQTISDRIKLILKKYLNTPNMRIFFFLISPLYRFCLSILSWFFFVIFYNFSFLECSVVITLLFRSVLVYALIWAGWGSSNTYSIVRRIRAVAQIISYEIVIGFFIFIFVLKFNSFSWGVFLFFNIDFFKNFFFFFFFFFWTVIFSAELNRTPFDLVERESELVRRYNVEYSRTRFTLLFLSEYISIWFISFLTSIIFFGYFLFFFIIVCCLIIIVIHIRATLPRYKFFDLIFLTWKIILPLVTIFILFFIL